MSQKLRLLLPLLALPIALSQPTNNTIKWTQCPFPTSLPSECGTLTVPLDYSSEISNQTIELNMLKLKAFKQPSKGSILLNFGGPGNSGIILLNSSQVQMTVMTGGHYDLIAIDPRGTGNTLPINCFPARIDRAVSGLRLPPTLDAWDTALPTAWAYWKAISDSCYEQLKDFGRFIGTSSVARDFMQVVDALGEDNMLRYWGQSYGTALGATLAVMFPARIERMVLDGVVNIHEYTDGWEYANAGVGQFALEKYLESCVKAGPKVCSLASKGSNASEIFAKIMDLDQQVRQEPIVLGSNITTDIVNPGRIPSAIDEALRVSIDYAFYLSEWLNGIMDGNLTAYQSVPKAFFSVANVFTVNDNLFAIRAVDSTFRTTELSEVKKRVEKLIAEDRFFGGVYGNSFLASTRWRMDSKGRYEGNWKTKTKNPVLLVGSPFDIRTPYKNALNMSAGFEDSVALQHNGLGHCVLYSPGQCAIKAVREYFTNGTLPAPGTVCEQDFDIFSGNITTDSFKLEDL